MIEFTKKNQGINVQEINLIEKLIGTNLPVDFKENLLEYNGGSVPINKKYSFEYTDEDDEKIETSLSTLNSVSQLKERFKAKHSFLYPKLLSIGSISGGYLAIGYQKDNFGEVYIYFSSEGPYKVANSFTLFLNNLEVTDEDF